jgi:uncharacterized protein with PIN domain
MERTSQQIPDKMARSKRKGNLMTCPHCEEKIEQVCMDDAKAIAGTATARLLVYTCPRCDFILSVERNRTQFHNDIMEELAALKKQINNLPR